MIKVNNEIDDTVKILYQNTNTLNRSCHIHLNQIFNDASATAVISVYVDERPADKVLSDLSAWAEQVGMNEVKDKIDEFTKLK